MANREKKQGEDAKSRSSEGSSVKRAGIPKAVFVVSSICKLNSCSPPGPHLISAHFNLVGNWRDIRIGQN